MKNNSIKLLSIFILIVLSASSYSKTICNQEDRIQKRNGVIYLPNHSEGFTGKNLCIWKKNYSGKWKETGVIFDTGDNQYASRGNYKDGKKDGKWDEWYSNGQYFYRGNYKDGKKDGKWAWWYIDGQKMSETNYPDGKYTSWDRDGHINEKGNYKNGKKHGKWVTYFSSNSWGNQKTSEGVYRNGKREGAWSTWNWKGGEHDKLLYKNGKCLSGPCGVVK